MPVLTNSKHEIFTQNWFNGETKTQSAIIAGYSPSRAPQTASRLVTYGKILARYEELQAAAASKKVMTRQEILERHSEIARAKITDFQTAGADGSWIDIGTENQHAGAIQEITSRTEYDKDGSSPSVVMKVKLHDPVRSMQEISKLQGHYPKENTIINTGDVIFVIGRGYQDVLESTRSPLEIVK